MTFLHFFTNLPFFLINILFVTGGLLNMKKRKYYSKFCMAAQKSRNRELNATLT